MADQVRQFESAHGKAAGIAHQCIQGRAIGNVFLQQAQAFGVERAGHTVDDKPRCRTGVHRLFTPGFGGGVQTVGQGRVARQAGDDFHQCHDRRRVEKMQPEQTLWAFQLGGNAGDRQRRSIAGQDALLVANAFQLTEEGAFDLQVLDDGFNDQRATGQILDGFHRLQAGDSHPAGVGREFAFFDALAQLPVDPVDSLGGGAWAVVQQQYRVAGLGCDLGDAGAHGPGTDHGDARCGAQCGHGSAPLEAWRAFFHEGADAFTVILAAPGQALQVLL